MAPFMKGDYVTYSGFKNAQGEIICYSILATNIQITTTGSPTYIRMEDVNIGIVGDTTIAEVAQTRVSFVESPQNRPVHAGANIRYQFIGYVSDSAATTVTISAIDYDVCAGTPTYRQVGIATVVAGAIRNKFEYRGTSQPGDKYTREYRITVTGGTRTTANGIIAGQYIQPVTEWIQPEQLNPGSAPLAHDFSNINYMTAGVGKDEFGTIWGPLTPFPQSGVTGLFDVQNCTAQASGSSNPPVVPHKDTVSATASWVSSGGGTLTVRCTSNNNNNALVKMRVDYILPGGASTTGLTATAQSPGVWLFSGSKIKKPTSVICNSALGGSATFIL